MKKRQDKFNAVWLSHSSVTDFLKCERLYFLKNIWKNQQGRKVNIVSPHMSLGSAVHSVLEPLANLKAEDRFKKNLLEIYEKNWEKYTGKMGGFFDTETENEFKMRGEKMIKNVLENHGPLGNKTVKFYTGDFIPNFYLSEKENIILCGLVDWVEYLPANDSLKVIDFKTGNNDEKEDSMQLPIYKILVESLQKRKVVSGAYWYLARDKFPSTVELIDEDVEEIKNKLLEIGRIIKNKKESSENAVEVENQFKCKYNGCKNCADFELIKINSSKAIYLGLGEYKQDLYFINH